MGNSADIVPDRFGPNLPMFREWTEQHYNFPGYIMGSEHSLSEQEQSIRKTIVYMWEAAKLLRAQGHPVLGEELVHTWPSRFEHLNVYGKFLIKIPKNQARLGLRPLLSTRQVEVEEAENL